MRALFDTNVLFSALLASSRPNSKVSEIVEAAIRGEFRMLVPEEVIGELIDVWERKKSRYPAISDEQMGRFIRLLRSIAEIIPPSDGPIPYVFRDRKDDFLLTACALGNADYLVTGDRDILDIREKLPRPVVLTIAEFLKLLSEAPSE